MKQKQKLDSPKLLNCQFVSGNASDQSSKPLIPRRRPSGDIFTSLFEETDYYLENISPKTSQSIVNQNSRQSNQYQKIEMVVPNKAVQKNRHDLTENQMNQERKLDFPQHLNSQFVPDNGSDQPSTPLIPRSQPSGGIVNQNSHQSNQTEKINVVVPNEAVQENGLYRTELPLNMIIQPEPQNAGYQSIPFGSNMPFDNNFTFPVNVQSEDVRIQQPFLNSINVYNSEQYFNDLIYRPNYFEVPFNSNEILQFPASGVPCTPEQYNSVNSPISNVNTENMTNENQEQIFDILSQFDLDNFLNSISHIQDTPSNTVEAPDFFNTPTIDIPYNNNEAFRSESVTLESKSQDNLTTAPWVNPDVGNEILHNEVPRLPFNVDLEEIPIQTEKFKKLNSLPDVVAIVNSTKNDELNRRRKQHTILQDNTHLCCENINRNSEIINNDSSDILQNFGENIVNSTSDKFGEHSSSRKQRKQPLAIKVKLKNKNETAKSEGKMIQSKTKRSSISGRTSTETHKKDSNDYDNDGKLKPIVSDLTDEVDKIDLGSPKPDIFDQSNIIILYPQPDLPKGTNYIPNKNGETNDWLPKNKSYQQSYEEFLKKIRSYR